MNLTPAQIEALKEVRDGVVLRGDRATKAFKYERDGLLKLGLIRMTNTWNLTDAGVLALGGN